MTKQTQFSPRTFGGLLEDIISGNAGRFFRDDATNDEWVRNAQQVAVNVKESDTAYTLEVIAPGIAKEDLKLNVNDKTLTISYDKKEEEAAEDTKWLRREFKARSFKRNFTLSDKVDIEKISASFENGILFLNLPKKETAIVTNKVIDIL